MFLRGMQELHADLKKTKGTFSPLTDKKPLDLMLNQSCFLFFLVSIIQQTILVMSEMILITKNAMNSGAGCCKSDDTDQYSAPSEVMMQTIQKKVMFSFMSYPPLA